MRSGAAQHRLLRSYRLVALVLATLFAMCGVVAVALARSNGILPDFVDFWAAGRLAAEGHPASAYDLTVHAALESQVAGKVGILPFPYPPFVLALLAPFGILPFWIGFAAWLLTTAGLYAVACRRAADLRLAFAQAAAAANLITGQNGFLTSAIFIGGARLLASRPFVGGLILGTLCIKPQLALLLPVALLAGREWRAIAGGIASSLFLVLLGLILFGSDSYFGFAAILPRYSQWLSAGRWPWGELASIFALLRWFGVPAGIAFAIHCVIALGAAALTARAWALRMEQRVAILASATLLIPPYLFTYDALLLTLPLGWMLSHGHWRAFALSWLLALLPLAAYATPFPNTIPLAAIVALAALHRPSAERNRRQAIRPAYQV